MKTALVAFCAASILGGTASAQVVVSTEPLPSERVSYADLNLASLDDRSRLVRRIQAAAERVCFVSNDRNLEKFIPEHRCYKTAVGGGIRQMNSVMAHHSTGAPVAAAAIMIHAH